MIPRNWCEWVGQMTTNDEWRLGKEIVNKLDSKVFLPYPPYRE